MQDVASPCVMTDPYLAVYLGTSVVAISEPHADSSVDFQFLFVVQRSYVLQSARCLDPRLSSIEQRVLHLCLAATTIQGWSRTQIPLLEIQESLPVILIGDIDRIVQAPDIPLYAFDERFFVSLQRYVASDFPLWSCSRIAS